MAQLLAQYRERTKGWVDQEIELKGIRDTGEEVEVYQASNRTLAIIVMIQTFSQPLEGAAMDKAEELGV